TAVTGDAGWRRGRADRARVGARKEGRRRAGPGALEGRPRRGGPPAAAKHLAAAAPQPPLLPSVGPASTVGSLEATLGQRDFGTASFTRDLDASFDTSQLSTLATEMDGRRLGQWDASAAAEVYTAQAWRPASSWREAVILREVLGLPLALRESAQPDLPC
ncbi:MAG: hypothetical protein H8E31_15480, partial [Planctomycetes bacterium]|nr:hypothetical protein [Planctomycetota bacterium]